MHGTSILPCENYGHGNEFSTPINVFTPVKFPEGWGLGIDKPQSMVELAAIVDDVFGIASASVVPGFASNAVPAANARTYVA